MSQPHLPRPAFLHPAVQTAMRLLPLLLILLPAALLLPEGTGFPYSRPDVAYTDMAISHYPYSLYLQRSLLAGRIPFWSPTILSGAPFAANPLSGLWYPPGWLALLFPLPLGFTLLILAHIALGGYGLFCLLQRQGLGLPAALFGGVAFALLPKVYAHYGAGHVTLLYAVPWTPWLLLAARRARQDGGFGWEALILALIVTADPRWGVYAAMAWLAYRLVAVRGGWLKSAWQGFGQALLAGLLAAPLLLPLLEFTRLSTRTHMAAVDQLLYSLPPERLLAYLYPDFGGFHEYTLYVGQAILALALLSFLRLAASRAVNYWRGLALIGLVWSLGALLPFAGALFSLPGLNLLRVPSRSLFLVGLALCSLAAHTLDGLLSYDVLAKLPVKRLRWARLMLAGLATLSIAMAAAVAMVAGPLPVNFAWGGAFLAVAAVWISLRLSARLSAPVFLAGIALLAGAELLAMDRSLFVQRSAKAILAEGRDVAEYLSRRAAPMRVYSPSYSLPQQTAADLKLEIADGVDPLKLESYSDFMDGATGVPRPGYSVTLPPLANGDPQHDNAAYTPDAARLGRLNVVYVASAFPLDAPGLLLEMQLGDTFVYRNTLARPRAWVQPSLESDWDPVTPAQIVALTPDRIDVRAAGPGTLVLAEIAYPGWRAAVDGHSQPLLTAGGLLRAVALPAGEHDAVFTFRPLSVYAGLALSAAAALFLLFAYLHRKTRLNHTATQNTGLSTPELQTTNS